MRHLYQLFFFFTLLIISTSLKSQNLILADSTQTTNIILEKEYRYGVIAHSRGLGLGAYFGHRKNFMLSKFWMIEAVNLRSTDQARLYNPFFSSAKSFFLGKLNYVYNLRFGREYSRLLSRKPYWNGIEMRLNYAYGLDLIFEKPYYIKEIKVDAQGELYTEDHAYDPDIHHEGNIYGRASFFDGFDQLRVRPGAFLRLSLSVEFDSRPEVIRMIEVGAYADVAPFGIDFSVSNQNTIVVPSFFLSFQFGKKYNKYKREERMNMELKNVE